ncbi:MAG: HD domain-containing protein [Bacteroidales bacterium]
MTNKLKIINDPVYGFINIPDTSIFDLLEHPYFQRLRHIKQLGLTHLVFPGALHTRFHHALGSMYLGCQAIEVLRSKGHDITGPEALGLTQAILLHDIGHGPFSHALEGSLVHNMNHEKISLLFMQLLNQTRNGALDVAISIFKDEYHKKFLHQLVSSQLDMDRLDYLNRDSFYTGVSEGVVSWDRIIKMLNVSGDNLVIDEKGIYSIEKFIIARRLMYWQVYLHKTVIAAEVLLSNILKRAKELAPDQELFCSPPLKKFLTNQYSPDDFQQDPTLLQEFSLLDDYDVFAAIKVWANHPDQVLSQLCRNMTERHLFRTKISKQPFEASYLEEIRHQTMKALGITYEQTRYFVVTGITRNHAYDPVVGNIWIHSREGTLTDLASASDQLNIGVLSTAVEKNYLCYSKQVLI